MLVNTYRSYVMTKSNIIILFISSGLFAVTIALGSLLNPDSLSNQEFIEPASFWGLFENNLIVCLILASGLFFLGIPTLIYLAMNGLIVGLAIKQHVNNGMSNWEVFLKLAPHGVLEIPALLLAGVIGFKGLHILIELFVTSKKFIPLIKEHLVSIFCIGSKVIIFLFFAALIEWYVTY
ncbi:stage II sporulation protein M [Halobacillus sp. B23F22_1]|uniref:stage II sporulation protein M n=1 Tax=Halobacillus sp. B23F22_1 TaxID=3459514 RepID=UPI00373F1A0B